MRSEHRLMDLLRAEWACYCLAGWLARAQDQNIDSDHTRPSAVVQGALIMQQEAALVAAAVQQAFAVDLPCRPAGTASQEEALSEAGNTHPVRGPGFASLSAVPEPCTAELICCSETLPARFIELSAADLRVGQADQTAVTRQAGRQADCQSFACFTAGWTQ